MSKLAWYIAMEQWDAACLSDIGVKLPFELVILWNQSTEMGVSEPLSNK